MAPLHSLAARSSTFSNGSKAQAIVALISFGIVVVIIFFYSCAGCSRHRNLEEKIKEEEETPVQGPPLCQSDSLYLPPTTDSPKATIDHVDYEGVVDVDETGRPLDQPPQVAVALYDYAAADDGELSFLTGDRIRVLQTTPEAIWQGELLGATGRFPMEYCDIQTAPGAEHDIRQGVEAEQQNKIAAAAISEGHRKMQEDSTELTQNGEKATRESRWQAFLLKDMRGKLNVDEALVVR